MGGGSSSQVWPQYDWEWLANENGLQLYQEKQHQWVAQKRTIVLDNRFTPQDEQEIYLFRRDNQKGLVKVYSAEVIEEQKNNQSSQLCKCSDVAQMVIYSERIPYRLSELPQLTFPESLYLMRSTLDSFEVVYDRMGPLHINPQLIGINAEGHSRVWVNQNWALNHPSHTMPTLKTSNHSNISAQTAALKDEAEMIQNLTCVIEDKTQEGRFPNNFGEQLRKSSSSFREAKRFVNGYISSENLAVPGYLKRDKIMKQVHNFNSIGGTSTRYAPSPVTTIGQNQYSTTKHEIIETIRTSRVQQVSNLGGPTDYKTGANLPSTSVSFNRPSEPLGINATAVRPSEYLPQTNVHPGSAELMTFGKPQLELGKDQLVRHSYEIPKLPEIPRSTLNQDSNRAFFKKYADHNSYEMPLSSFQENSTEHKAHFSSYSDHHHYGSKQPTVAESEKFNFSLSSSRPQFVLPQSSSNYRSSSGYR